MDEQKRPVMRRPLSFVRRSNNLPPRRQRAWDAALGHELLDIPHGERDTAVADGFRIDWDAEFGRRAHRVLEIGTGSGEAVVHAAHQNPDTDFIAVEVYRPGVAQLASRLRREGLTNVRIACVDAVELIDKLMPRGTVDELWVFFPDPWHKTKHHKRRLVQEPFIDRVARLLPEGGLWRLATDWSGYAAQMRDLISADARFTNLHAGERSGEESPLTAVRHQGLEKQDPLDWDEALDEVGGWAPRFDGRVLTDFEAKAHEAGRRIFDLTFRREG
ncbi:tRNA (guanosine(46)-N7)-methyltransferase TrmB [Nesterenkonia marinintestina]|uniref:tRNA (guanosine(46)-N7)-methyltransferase TrmB n=1 Tax=Nesterenkonia marinintestina TaxID=2979865 RepID=UPI0021BF379F|nr:tRNA (guanosine(46)-N7)-methyltransferase TrmB [Nesterenkonia sp. GX14115]